MYRKSKVCCSPVLVVFAGSFGFWGPSGFFPFFATIRDSFWLSAVNSAGAGLVVSCKSMKVRFMSAASEDFGS